MLRCALIGLCCHALLVSAGGSHCSVHGSSCSACVADETILGTCRFCPVDQSCHDAGAVATNPCSSVQNIVTPAGCDVPPIPPYNETKAKQMVLFSAVAYAPLAKQQACLDKAVPGQGFTIFSSLEVPCAAGLNMSNTVLCGAVAAVSETIKRVVLSFRGSVSSDQVIAEVLGNLANYAQYSEFQDASIGEYWLDVYKSLVKVAVDADAKAKSRGYELWITGHSLGGALASIAAFVIGAATPRTKISSYTFGQPRVGLFDFAQAHDLHVPDSYRVIHDNDLVPHVPWCRHVKFDFWLPLPVCASWGGAVLPNWYHHGTEVFYKGDNMTSYVVCRGVPHNEDLTSHCADQLYATHSEIPSTISGDVIAKHRHYFGIRVMSGYCKSLEAEAAVELVI